MPKSCQMRPRQKPIGERQLLSRALRLAGEDPNPCEPFGVGANAWSVRNRSSGTDSACKGLSEWLGERNPLRRRAPTAFTSRRSARSIWSMLVARRSTDICSRRSHSSRWPPLFTAPMAPVRPARQTARNPGALTIACLGRPLACAAPTEGPETFRLPGPPGEEKTRQQSWIEGDA
jgi:hypothetical protein